MKLKVGLGKISEIESLIQKDMGLAMGQESGNQPEWSRKIWGSECLLETPKSQECREKTKMDVLCLTLCLMLSWQQGGAKLCLSI